MKCDTHLSWAILVFGLWGQPVSAEPPQPVPPCCGSGHCSIPLLRGCPDDYCRKPMPEIHCLPCGKPDDYCRKPCPRTWQMHPCGGVDDYDRKPCPPPCPPMCTSQYICVNFRRCCSTPCQQQPWQSTPPPVILEEAGYRPDQGGNLGSLPAGGGPTKGMRPLSPNHLQ
jgi:hypothetical protein